jgi:hypothetical protein
MRSILPVMMSNPAESMMKINPEEHIIFRFV